LDKLYDDNSCLVALTKQKINWEEAKETTGKLRNGQLLPQRVRFVQKQKAPPSLSRDRRIKMQQNILQTNTLIFIRAIL